MIDIPDPTETEAEYQARLQAEADAKQAELYDAMTDGSISPSQARKLWYDYCRHMRDI